MSPLPNRSDVRICPFRMGYVVLLLLAVVLFVTMAPGVVVADVPSELEQYTNRVGSALELAESVSGDDLSTEDAEELALGIDTLLPGIETIEISGGTVRVDNSILRSLTTRLAAAENTTQRARIHTELVAHLRSMNLALQGDPSAVPYDPAVLEEILGTQYAPQRSLFAEFFGDLMERIAAALERWWAGAGASEGTSTLMTLGTIGVMALLLATLVILLMRALIRALRARAFSDAPGVATLSGSEVRVPEDLPADPLAAADLLAADGSLTEAVQMLLRGATRMLRQAGRLRQTRSRTNGELLRQVASDPEVGDPLAGLAHLFDRAYFGHRVPDSREYAAARVYYERLSRVGGAGDGAGDEAA